MDNSKIGVYLNKRGICMIKGQAAFEFLMTYGWVFLIISLVVGSLYYFKILNPGSYVKTEVYGFSSFLIEDWKLFSDGNFLMIVNNQIDHEVGIQKIIVNNKLIKIYSPEIQAGTGESVTLSDILTDKTGKAGISTYKISVIMEYEDLVTHTLHNDTGTFIGKFE